MNAIRFTLVYWLNVGKHSDLILIYAGFLNYKNSGVWGANPVKLATILHPKTKKKNKKKTASTTTTTKQNKTTTTTTKLLTNI